MSDEGGVKGSWCSLMHVGWRVWWKWWRYNETREILIDISPHLPIPRTRTSFRGAWWALDFFIVLGRMETQCTHSSTVSASELGENWELAFHWVLTRLRFDLELAYPHNGFYGATQGNQLTWMCHLPCQLNSFVGRTFTFWTFTCLTGT